MLSIDLLIFMASALTSLPPQEAAQANAPTPIVMPYADVIACAGVTQAMSELEGGESEHGRRLYDAALYWSLTAIQLGQASGRPDVRTETDMTNARIRSVRELNRHDAKAVEHLENCIKSAPKLG